MSQSHCLPTPPSPVPSRCFSVRACLRSSLSPVTAEVEVRYVLHGELSKPCLVVLGGISAGADAQDWWHQQVGPGRALDTRSHAVLGIEYLKHVPQGFSALTPADQASALVAVLDHLGIAVVEACVGASYGGAVTLAFAERWPQRLSAALVLSMAHRPSPMASALRAVQRELLRLGKRHDFDTQAVALARALAITCYRSEAEFATRFDAPAEHRDGRWRLPVESYLEAQGRRFAERFDAQSYATLSESLDLHRVDPGAIHTPLYLLAVDQDRLVPRSDMEALAELSGASLYCLSSQYGHDAFLTEPDAISAWLVNSLTELRRMRRSAA